MNKRLSKKDRAIIDNLDRMLAGQQPLPPGSFLEDKLWQALKQFETNERKRAVEQESVSKLMSDVSHQLKTPLASLGLHLELASDSSLSEAERAAALDECKNQAEKIRYLSDAMFKVARLETGIITITKIEEDVLATLGEAVRAVTPHAAAKNLEIETHLPNEPLVIPHDPVWTKEAFVNLLDNAVKYTDAGVIRVTAEQGAIYTRIDIADTGIGLDQDEYTNIFKRFYRVRETKHYPKSEQSSLSQMHSQSERYPKSEQSSLFRMRSRSERYVEGTGLGLPIAREIMRRQGGNITVSSTPNEGSVFSVFLQNC